MARRSLLILFGLLLLLPSLALAQGRSIVQGEACTGDLAGTFPACTIPAEIARDTELHTPLTLDVNAETLLSLNVQELGLDTQSANLVWAGPASGVASVPTFRLLTAADIPALDTAKITTGTFADARIAQSNVTQHQAALSITESQIADLAHATQASLSVDDLITLSGVVEGSLHLGTFTGTTITDNVTVKAALQEVETAVEAAGTGHDAVTLDVNADTLLSLTTQTLGLDTQLANTVLAGPTGGAAAVPTFRLLAAADIPALDTAKITTGVFADARISQSSVTQHQAALSITESQVSDLAHATQASLSVDDLITLSGVLEGALHLGTFTGTTITDNQTVKAALQEIETAVEGATGSPGGVDGDVQYNNGGVFGGFGDYNDVTDVMTFSGVVKAPGFEADPVDDGATDYTPATAGESLWSTGPNHDGTGDDNDCYEVRQSTTPGTSVVTSFCPDGTGTLNGSPLHTNTTTVTKSIYWPAGSLSSDGTNCADPAEVTLNSGPKQYTILCTDNDASRIHGMVVMPDGWDAGTVTFEVAYVQTAVDTAVLNLDVAAACRAAGATVNATYGTEVAIDDAAVTGSNAVDMTTSGAVTANGTCAAGDLLYWYLDVDATGTTTAMGTLHFVGVKLAYTTTVGD